MAKKDNLEIQERFIELRALGKSYSEIAEELHVSKRSLIEWSKRLEIEVQNLRAIELEALLDKHLLSREKKLEMLKGFLDKAKEDFLKRDLTDLGTKELFDLILRLVSMVEVGVTFKERVFSTAFDDMSRESIKEWPG